MEQTEPSLFPEWFRHTGVNGNGNSAHHGQAPASLDDNVSYRYRQRNSSGVFDYDSSKQSVASYKALHSSSRRAAGNFERDSYQHERRHFNFGRAPSYRSFEVSDRERGSQQRVRDWESESDSDRLLNSAGVDDYQQRNDVSCRPGASGVHSSARYDSGVALKRSQSMNLPSSILENGDKKFPRGATPSVVPVNSGGIPGRTQKTAFEKNFPSLGSQDRYTALGGGTPVSSPRLLKQSTFSKLDVSHSLSAGSSISGTSALDVSVNEAVSVNDLKGGSVALFPMSNLTLHNLPSNGSVASAGTAVIVNSAQMPALSSAILPKMAEALTQNPPRVRSPPQVPSESQRLEELALKQSRQLIPMKPSLPKTMGSREKSKAKSVRIADMAVSNNNSRTNQLVTSSQLTSSTYRPPFSPKPEVPKLPQGKFLLLKTSKEKQVFDSQAMNSSQLVTTEGEMGNTSRGKEIVVEDKRTLLQAQNRTDFFNALRKKAASNLITSESTDKADSCKDSGRNSSTCTNESEKIPTDCVELQSEIVDKKLQSSVVTEASILKSSVQQKASMKNGLIVDIPEAVLDNPGASDGRITGTSEEEEAAFLRSLGWEEGTDEGEALTEEEINAFYQHKQTLSRSVSLPNYYNSRQSWRSAVNLHVGSISSVSSGLGSSSDSDEEPRF